MTRPNFIKLTDDQVQARKRRNVAIALGLVGFIVLVFIVTVTNLQRNTEARKAAEAAAAATLERADPALPAPVPAEGAPVSEPAQ
ncbi:hypothetical protein [Brevundimonas sp.]|uniref:hypothetical protein n=1 Tax=Brevundimonas sp. TaxID=1871086 RepID=UPI0028B16E0D|nr:hypothetical protein [Brevundimonas sp.]